MSRPSLSNPLDNPANHRARLQLQLQLPLRLRLRLRPEHCSTEREKIQPHRHGSGGKQHPHELQTKAAVYPAGRLASGVAAVKQAPVAAGNCLLARTSWPLIAPNPRWFNPLARNLWAASQRALIRPTERCGWASASGGPPSQLQSTVIGRHGSPGSDAGRPRPINRAHSQRPEPALSSVEAVLEVCNDNGPVPARARFAPNPSILEGSSQSPWNGSF